MIGFSATKSSMDIKANLGTQCDMVEDRLVAHALSECDMVKILSARFFKKRILKNKICVRIYCCLVQIPLEENMASLRYVF